MAQSDRLARDPRADMTELSADWLAPAINPTLTRLQDRLPDDGVDMRPVLTPIPQAEQDTSAEREFVKKRSGLRIRLLIVDVIAVAGTWLLLGAMLIPATSANRRWVSAVCGRHRHARDYAPPRAVPNAAVRATRTGIRSNGRCCRGGRAHP